MIMRTLISALALGLSPFSLLAQDIAGEYDVTLRGTNVFLDRTPPSQNITGNTTLRVTQSGDRVTMELGSFAGASAATVFEGKVGNDRFAAVWWTSGSDHETKVMWGTVTGNTLRGDLIYPRVAALTGLVPGWVDVSFTARKREAVAELREDCLSFDPEGVRITREGRRWLLGDGSSRMKMFDVREEALVAVQIIEHYGMNRHCFIGRPDPSLEYWLVDEGAPSGAMEGEDCLSFDLDGLLIRRQGGNWLLMDGAHSLLAFPNRNEADQAMNTLRAHGFSRTCYVGRPDPSMTYFRR